MEKMENARNWVLAPLSVLIVILIINVVFFVMPLLSRLSASFFPARSITVTAEGKATATPDIAEVSFSVVTQGQNPQTLSSNNADKMNAVLQFVKSEGIADRDIKTTSYDLSPNYQWDKNTQRNFIVGYTLTQSVLVKVRDLAKVASLLGGLAPLGVNQIGNVNFTFDDPEKFLAAARDDAFTKVKAKAMAMASEAGISLGRAVTVSEYGSPTPRPYYLDKSYAAGGASAALSIPAIQPGTQDVTDDITVVYEIQ